MSMWKVCAAANFEVLGEAVAEIQRMDQMAKVKSPNNLGVLKGTVATISEVDMTSNRVYLSNSPEGESVS